MFKIINYKITPEQHGRNRNAFAVCRIYLKFRRHSRLGRFEHGLPKHSRRHSKLEMDSRKNRIVRNVGDRLKPKARRETASPRSRNISPYLRFSVF